MVNDDAVFIRVRTVHERTGVQAEHVPLILESQNDPVRRNGGILHVNANVGPNAVKARWGRRTDRYSPRCKIELGLCVISEGSIDGRGGLQDDCWRKEFVAVDLLVCGETKGRNRGRRI